MNKLSDRQIKAIVQRAGTGESFEKIAPDYSVHPDTVRAWCNKAGLIPRRLREIRKERRPNPYEPQPPPKQRPPHPKDFV